jgi:hypothetical protein
MLLIHETGGDLNSVKAGLESWFDDTMDRLSGAFKRWSQWWLVIIGIGVALLLNLSAVRIVTSLWTDAPVRAAVADAASEYIHQNPPSTPDEGLNKIQTAINDLDSLKLPVGWGDDWDHPAGALWTVLGTGITGLAVMMGAPFWFDLLTKLVSARKARGEPQRASDDSASATRIVATTDRAPLVGPMGVDREDALATFLNSLPSI